MSERGRMVAEIDAMIAETAAATGVRALSPAVHAAIESVPRHEYVPDALDHSAYANHPLPIGSGQTISQPYIVALMTELLAPAAGHRVLEIGTGSGYQAAVLAAVVADVYTIEIIEALGVAAQRRFERLGTPNVHVRIGDGWHGWPEAAPFDGIIVTAVSEQVPPALVRQLRPGGRLVIPLGPEHGAQYLTLAIADASLPIEADPGQRISLQRILPVRFVPFTRDPEAEPR